MRFALSQSPPNAVALMSAPILGQTQMAPPPLPPQSMMQVPIMGAGQRVAPQGPSPPQQEVKWVDMDIERILREGGM